VFAAGGLCVAAVIAWAMVRAVSLDAPVTPWVVVACVLGGVLGFLLHRLKVALGAGVAMAILLPALAGLFAPVPDSQVPARLWAAADRVHEAAVTTTRAIQEARAAKQRPDPAAVPRMESVLGEALAGKGGVSEAWWAWWSQMHWAVRVLMAVMIVGGFAAGVVMGLRWFDTAAMAVTAVGGASMMTAGAVRLVYAFGPEGLAQALPHTLLRWMIVVGALAVIGLGVQFALFREEATASPVKPTSSPADRDDAEPAWTQAPATAPTWDSETDDAAGEDEAPDKPAASPASEDA